MKTALTELVGCDAPIQQAPMGGVATPQLAAAVADAGGIGSVSMYGMSPGQVDGLLADLTSRTSGAIAAHFMTADIDREAVAAAAKHARVIDFFWTDPDSALIALAHEGGALVTWQTGSVDEAKAAVDGGCDFVVVQGIEAGGHVRGNTPVRELLDATLAAVSVPVLSAGGVGDAAAFRSMLDAGAAGVRAGTRFLATNESGAHPLYKQAVVAAAGADTEISAEFALCPLCATQPTPRVLSAAVAAKRALEDDVAGEAVLGGNAVQIPKGHALPPSATTTGHIEAMAMYAGMSADAIHDIKPVAAVIAGWTA